MKTIALAIPHCSWDPDRHRTVKRLLNGLGVKEIPKETQVADVFEGEGPSVDFKFIVKLFAEPGPAHCSVWSDKMWTWGEQIDADEFLTIQDDAVVAPNFWAAFRAMCEAVPNEIIGLQAIHPFGPNLAQAGANWYTTRDMLAGVSYRIPRDILKSFNKWRHEQLREGTEKRLNEDNLVALFAVCHGLRIWHPLPTIVDHHPPAEPIRSNYGHDSHSNRNVTWSWREKSAPVTREEWEPRNPIPAVNVDGTPVKDAPPVVHLGRFYQHTPWHLARNVVNWTEEEMQSIERDLVRLAPRT